MKPTVYRCACKKVFTPKTFPYTYNCNDCGAQITVAKPAKDEKK